MKTTGQTDLFCSSIRFSNIGKLHSVKSMSLKSQLKHFQLTVAIQS